MARVSQKFQLFCLQQLVFGTSLTSVVPAAIVKQCANVHALLVAETNTFGYMIIHDKNNTFGF